MLALAAAGASLAIAVPSAQAGQYHVYGCRTPAGQPAPADGWTGSVAAGGAYDQYARNTCGEGGALIAALGDATGHGAYVDRATWTFTAPSVGRVVSANLHRAGDNAGGSTPSSTYAFWLAGPAENS